MTSHKFLTRFFHTGEVWLVMALLTIWLSHVIQVFVPETGFDALWYHLPLLTLFQTSHTISYLPSLPQSASPLLGDLMYLPSFSLAGSFGTKIFAYVVGLLVLFITYRIARQLMNRSWSLASLLVVSLIQPLAWQAASFYTDTLKALWELCFLYLCILIGKTAQRTKDTKHHQTNQWLVLAGLCFGASLATKAFSLLLLPTVLVMLYWVIDRQWRKWLRFFLSTALVAVPFYLFTYLATQQLLFTVIVHLNKLKEIGGQISPISYVLTRTWLLPTAFIAILKPRDYISPLVIFCLPIILWLIKTWQKQSLAIHLVAVFTLGQLLIWWFVPPLSTRYALAGFISLLLLISAGLQSFSVRFPQSRWLILSCFALAILVGMAPRLYVNVRSMTYLSGQQTQSEYLTQFLDGHIDQHLQRWYGLNLEQSKQ